MKKGFIIRAIAVLSAMARYILMTALSVVLSGYGALRLALTSKMHQQNTERLTIVILWAGALSYERFLRRS